MPSPICQVKVGAGAYQATTFGVDITPGAVVTIKLADITDVDSWTIYCLSTDELSDKAAINLALVIDNPTKTATFTAPASYGRTLRFVSQINNRKDRNFVERDDYTTTLCLYLPTVGGLRTLAVDERMEGNPNFGWIASYNNALRNPPTGELNTASNVGTGAGLWQSKVGADLRFRSLTNGANIACTQDTNDVSIGVTVGGSNTEVLVRSSGAIGTATNVKAGSGFISIGADPATTGAIRFTTDGSTPLIYMRLSGIDYPVIDTVGTVLYLGATGWYTRFRGYSAWLVSTTDPAQVWGQNTLGLTFYSDRVAASLPRHGESTPYASEGRISSGMADANQTASASLYQKYFNKISGTNTATRTLTYPHPSSESNSYKKHIENVCTGGDLIISTGTGTTVRMTTNQAAELAFTPSGVALANNVMEAQPDLNGLRLTLSTGAPIADVSNGSTLYLTPYKAGAIALYDGQRWLRRVTAEISISLSGLTTGKNYDVFVNWNGSACVLSLVVWSSDTARATSLATQDGVYVQSGDATKRYVGTIRATSATQTQDSLTQRFVWNFYNRVRRVLQITEATASWSYTTTGTWRQVRGQTSNQVEYVSGELSLVELAAHGMAQANNGNFGTASGVGINSTTVNSAQIWGSAQTTANQVVATESQYRGMARVGYSFAAWLEITNFNPTTFYGASTYQQTGMVGSIEC